MPKGLGFTLSQVSGTESTEEMKQVFQPWGKNEVIRPQFSEYRRQWNQCAVHTRKRVPLARGTATQEARTRGVNKPRTPRAAGETQNEVETLFQEETNKTQHHDLESEGVFVASPHFQDSSLLARETMITINMFSFGAS